MTNHGITLEGRYLYTSVLHHYNIFFQSIRKSIDELQESIYLHILLNYKWIFANHIYIYIIPKWKTQVPSVISTVAMLLEFIMIRHCVGTVWTKLFSMQRC
jgi:hypothetical protein